MYLTSRRRADDRCRVATVDAPCYEFKETNVFIAVRNWQVMLIIVQMCNISGLIHVYYTHVKWIAAVYHFSSLFIVSLLLFLRRSV
jgi:hypothetical protein